MARKRNKKKKKAPPAMMTEEQQEVMKGLISDRRNQFPRGQKRKSFSFTWKSIPIPKIMESELTRKVVKRGKYGPMSNLEKEAIDEYIATMTFEEEEEEESIIKMSLSQVVSLRDSMLRDKTTRRHHAIMGKFGKEITERYRRGQGILSLSKKYDAPPVNLFRNVLAGRGMTKEKIKLCLKDPEKHLDDIRDRRELSKACRSDNVSGPDCDGKHERGEIFEAITARFLADLGVAFVTQADLIKEQESTFGRVLASPDFLVLDHLVVNGLHVGWIDCKAYYGANSTYILRDVRKQSARYKEYWGNGSILFLEGFSEALVVGKEEEEGYSCLSARDFMDARYFEPLID